MSSGGAEVNDSSMDLLMTKQMFRIRALEAMNVTNVTKQFVRSHVGQSIAQELKLENPENFVSDYVDETEHKFDEVERLEKRIQILKQYLKILEEQSKDSFYFSIFCAVY